VTFALSTAPQEDAQVKTNQVTLISIKGDLRISVVVRLTSSLLGDYQLQQPASQLSAIRPI